MLKYHIGHLVSAKQDALQKKDITIILYLSYLLLFQYAYSLLLLLY